MKYTFEVTIAGCSNECAHCCVSGGKSAVMTYEDFTWGMARLTEILQSVPGEKWVTFGNEIFNHPRISDILRFAKEIMPEYYSYHINGIPTTGIALLSRKDKREVIEAVKETGCPMFNLTLHGNREHHNLIAKNERTYDSVLGAAAWLSGEGFPIEFNLMLNKYLISDWNYIAGVVKQYPSAYTHITVPSYLPVDRLRGFQKYRAEYGDCLKLHGRLSPVGIDEADFFERAKNYCEKNVAKTLEDLGCYDYKAEEERSPEWAFFNITQNLDIYYGNAGLHTRLIGNMRTAEADEIRRQILESAANYDWSAYYSLNELPDIEEIIKRVTPLETDYVYSSVNDCIYSWLDKSSVKTKLTI